MSNAHKKITEALEDFYSESIVFYNNSPMTVKLHKMNFIPFLRENPDLTFVNQLTQDVFERYLVNGKLKKDVKGGKIKLIPEKKNL